MVEYGGMIIGLNLLREKKVKKIHIFGDSELILNQVKRTCQDKNPRMSPYQNEIWDLFSIYFYEREISLICGEKNGNGDSLAKTASPFRIPIYPNEKYDINVTHRTSILDNTRNLEVFEENRKKLRRFLERTHELPSTAMDKHEYETTEKYTETTNLLNIVSR